ncbi:hypothetical protein DL762_003451 [Monosporascus cannonballus]|uniref:Fork-head domain-containing protein n=1 Tax=Monosporascus cannonballus TaxID=155416 RepID=A0ABY0HAK7_9PEZI|nr:hypothetical protein DL762_003451 [Monosporascus cannonballus]
MTSSNAVPESGRGSPPLVPEVPDQSRSHRDTPAPTASPPPPAAPLPNAPAPTIDPSSDPIRDTNTNPDPDPDPDSKASPTSRANSTTDAPVCEHPHPLQETIDKLPTTTITTPVTTTVTTTTTANNNSTSSPGKTGSRNSNAAAPAARLHIDTNFDTYQMIPSPPTVSPLSTPAATHINVDDIEEEDIDTPGDQKHSSNTANSKNNCDDTQPRIGGTAEPADWKTRRKSTSAQPAKLNEASTMEVQRPGLPAFHQLRRLQNQIQAIATTDPEPESMNFPLHSPFNMRHANANVDPSTLMMALARASSTPYNHGHADIPNHVAPSEVSIGASLTQVSDAITGSVDPSSTNASQNLESFARLEFADSVYMMTTYAVIIGRDTEAMKQARKAELEELKYKRKLEEHARLGLPPPSPVGVDRGKYSKSYVSEEGGMLGPAPDGEDDVAPSGRKRWNSSVNRSRDGDEEGKAGHITSSRQYVSHTPGAATVDISNLRPPPDKIPFLAIHSPGPDIAKKTRGISRNHLKIQFNRERGVFEAISLHRNGFFVEDKHCGLDHPPVTLKSGAHLQVKDVAFRFYINGVEDGKTGGEDDGDEASSKRLSIGGKEMSFDFEHSDHENFRDTSDDLTPPPAEVKEPTPIKVLEEEEEGEEEDDDDEENENVNEDDGGNGNENGNERGNHRQQDDQMTFENLQALVDATRALESDAGGVMETTEMQDVIREGSQSKFVMPQIPKRRGPGRPPKDGIMSKRERRLLKKQMQETSRKTLPQEPAGEKIRRPVGRPRKNPLPEDGEKPEKRKYTKRRREDGEEGSDAEKRAKEKKDKKVRPKSPPLELQKEDFTEEQLQKPSKNYGVLIDEALTNGPPDGLTLKQIYKRIMQRYPWFYFSAETKGWESSVRHNLIGNEAFKKSEITGLWSRVPGIELDAGKKRKATSPDRHMASSHPHLSHIAQQPYYQAGPYLPQHNVNYGHGAAMQQQPQATYQATAPFPTPSAQPVAQAVAPAQLPPGYGVSALSRPPGAPQQSTYSSPYARPPPPSTPAVKTETTASSNPQNLPLTQGQQTQGQPSQQQPRQAIPGATNHTTRLSLTPEIERAIAQFKTNMLNNLSKHTKHAGQIIDTAINKVKGLPAQAPVPGFETVEKALVDGLQTMIKSMQGSRQNTTSASPAPAANATATKSTVTPSTGPSAAADEEIQRRIKSFRDNIIGPLKKKTDQAEAIVDSAINRAKGLPNPGSFRGWEEADRLMYESVTKIISDVRKAHGLGPRPSSSTPAPSQPQPSAAAQAALQPIQKAPSASPAPAQPSTSSAPPQQSSGVAAYPPAASPPPAEASTSVSKPMSPSITRHGASIARPITMGIARPGMTSIARPPVTRPESGSHSTTLNKNAPALTPNISSPAPPSAGVVSQIANSQQRSPDEVTRSVSSPAPPSAGVLDQITGHKRAMDMQQSETREKPAAAPTVSSTLAATSVPAPAHAPNMTNPTPPSAGVLDQITGQQRSAENATKAAPAPTPIPITAAAPPLNTGVSTKSHQPTSKPSVLAAVPTPSASRSITTGGQTISQPQQRQQPAGVVNTSTSAAASAPLQKPVNTASVPTSATTVAPAPAPAPVSAPPPSLSAGTSGQTAAKQSPQPTNASNVPTSASAPSSLSTPSLGTATGGQTPSQPQKLPKTSNVSASASVLAPSSSLGTPNGGKAGSQPQQPANTTNVPASAPAAALSLGAATSGQTAGELRPADNTDMATIPTSLPKPNVNVVSQTPAQMQPQRTDAPQRGPSPPQPKPSAGVVEQILGQKRSLDEGPGEDQDAQQPEAKKLAVSPT